MIQHTLLAADRLSTGIVIDRQYESGSRDPALVIDNLSARVSARR
jgi:hypothetical protein